MPIDSHCETSIETPTYVHMKSTPHKQDTFTLPLLKSLALPCVPCYGPNGALNREVLLYTGFIIVGFIDVYNIMCIHNV